MNVSWSLHIELIWTFWYLKYVSLMDCFTCWSMLAVNCMAWWCCCSSMSMCSSSRKSFLSSSIHPSSSCTKRQMGRAVNLSLIRVGTFVLNFHRFQKCVQSCLFVWIRVFNAFRTRQSLCYDTTGIFRSGISQLHVLLLVTTFLPHCSYFEYSIILQQSKYLSGTLY